MDDRGVIAGLSGGVRVPVVEVVECLLENREDLLSSVSSLLKVSEEGVDAFVAFVLLTVECLESVELAVDEAFEG